MKKVFFSVLLLFALSDIALGQPSQTSAYVHGYWTDWRDQAIHSIGIQHYYCNLLTWTDSGAFAGLEIRTESAKQEPWNWCFKVYLDGDYFSEPQNMGKRATKKYWKDFWEEHGEFDREDLSTLGEFPGWVEYYVSDEYPTIEKILEEEQFPFIDPTTETSGKIVKRKAKAVIKLYLHVDSPPSYGYFKIFFDGCGLRMRGFPAWF